MAALESDECPINVDQDERTALEVAHGVAYVVEWHPSTRFYRQVGPLVLSSSGPLLWSSVLLNKRCSRTM